MSHLVGDRKGEASLLNDRVRNTHHRATIDMEDSRRCALEPAVLHGNRPTADDCERIDLAGLIGAALAQDISRYATGTVKEAPHR